MSNTTKIKATRKKWTEKNPRLSPLVLNPHSKGDIFSMSLKDFRERAIIKINNSPDRTDKLTK
jgi:hypothetical protein